jgi:ABC-type spermidine/putrescine transport system permease subunit II
MVLFSLALCLSTTACAALWLKRTPFKPKRFRLEYILAPLVVLASVLQVALVVIAASDRTELSFASGAPR